MIYTVFFIKITPYQINTVIIEALWNDIEYNGLLQSDVSFMRRMLCNSPL